MTVQPLTDLEQDILAFAALQWRFTGSRAAAIRARWDWTETEFFRRLDQLIDKPAALAAHPVLVKRLRRMRSVRLSSRGVRRAS